MLALYSVWCDVIHAEPPIPSTPITQSFLTRLMNALTPAKPQPPPHAMSNTVSTGLLENGRISTKGKTVEETAVQKREEGLGRGRRDGGREGRWSGTGKRERGRGGKMTVEQSCRDLKAQTPYSLGRSNRKRKRDELESNYCSPFSNTSMIEMKEFWGLSTKSKALFSPNTQHYSPSLPLFLSPSPSLSIIGSIHETPSSFFAASPSHCVRSSSNFSPQNESSFGASPLRRSRRLVQRRVQRSSGGNSALATSFTSPVSFMYAYVCTCNYIINLSFEEQIILHATGTECVKIISP